MKWLRREGGYMSEDGEWFLSRGARMTHGANAWLVHRRITGTERDGRDDTHLAYDTTNGCPIYTVDALGYLDPAYADTTEDVYAHEFDCGWLDEAKAVVERLVTA